MQIKNYRLIIFTVIILLILFVGFQLKEDTKNKNLKETFSQADLQYGANGEDVYELQGRMKFLGFFYGDVDGQFGYNTLKSVKYFQSEFGLNVDGIVGPKTKLKLWEATKAWAPTEGWKAIPSTAGNAGGNAGGNAAGNATSGNNDSLPPSSRLGVTDNDIRLMANAVYGESRGEPYKGQVAVASVIINRVKSSKFPNSVAGVIYQPGAFTAVSDGQINLTPNATAKNAVQDALAGYDPTGGCIYYFNPVTATSSWIWSRPQVMTIGKHIFCM
ncbi:MAG: hydrolase [Bacilli bacterium]|nr:hydrolase [Bacilli bacterium]